MVLRQSLVQGCRWANGPVESFTELPKSKSQHGGAAISSSHSRSFGCEPISDVSISVNKLFLDEILAVGGPPYSNSDLKVKTEYFDVEKKEWFLISDYPFKGTKSNIS